MDLRFGLLFWIGSGCAGIEGTDLRELDLAIFVSLVREEVTRS